MLNKIVLRQTIHVVFFLLIFAVKPAMSECPNIKDIKMVKSFGIEICAMPKVEDKFLNHAKKIMDKLYMLVQFSWPDNFFEPARGHSDFLGDSTFWNYYTKCFVKGS